VFSAITLFLIGFLKIYSYCRTQQKTFKRNVENENLAVCVCVYVRKMNMACGTVEKDDKSILLAYCYLQNNVQNKEFNSQPFSYGII